MSQPAKPTKSEAPWMASYTDIWTSVKFRRLVRALSPASAEAVHGHVHRLWHSQVASNFTGELAGWTAEDIADAANWSITDAQTFVAALVESGWLAPSGHPRGGFLLHEWEAYGGQYLRSKEKHRALKAAQRSKASGGRPQDNPETSEGHGGEVHRMSIQHNNNDNITMTDITKTDTTNKESGRPAAPVAPALRPIIVVEPPEPQETLDERADRLEGIATARMGQRAEITDSRARAGGILGRPQAVRPLLDLRVVEDADHVLRTAGEGEAGEELGKVWARRYASLDGKGEPRRASLGEVLIRVWAASKRWGWTVDGAAYLARWGGILADEAAKNRYAWERDGSGTAADPDRAAARRKYVALQATRDMPPFDTWYLDAWKRGRADEDIPEFDGTVTPSSQGSGSRPAGPSSGATRPTVVAAADHYAQMAPEAAAGGFEAMRKAQAAPRTITIPTTEVPS